MTFAIVVASLWHGISMATCGVLDVIVLVSIRSTRIATVGWIQIRLACALQRTKFGVMLADQQIRADVHASAAEGQLLAAEGSDSLPRLRVGKQAVQRSICIGNAATGFA